MSGILSAIACNLDADILSASVPLLEEGRIEAIEWSFDTLFQVEEMPFWFADLLKTYSAEKRLTGHGVFFSLFAGRWSPDQQNWLLHLKKLSSAYNFDHITEHFGFMTGQNFHSGAPLPVPFNSTTLRIGRDRLARIQDACNCPVGLENLAFSYSPDEVKQQGEFLDKLTEPVNGFIILDLHNIYCQTHNFSITFQEILSFYPLDKVREIHLSGGSWEDSVVEPPRKVRRDTHDGAVPEEVFKMLALTIDKCPNLKYVVLEQIGTGLKSEKSRSLFYHDFLKMEKIVQAKNKSNTLHQLNTFFPREPIALFQPEEDVHLYEQQLELSEILETSSTFEEAARLLNKSSLALSGWKIENWEPYMLETAFSIARKWKR